jgi:hypothetical protein
MDPTVTFTSSVAGIIIGLMALCIAAGRLWAAIYPIYARRRDRLLLVRRFGRGPYDKYTIRLATQYYIRPKYQDIDPSREQELRHALSAAREDLFKKVDRFLDVDGAERHLLLLGDSGTGKTSFVLNYYAHNEKRPKRKRHRIALAYLGHRDSDELIAKIPDKEDTAIFLDAFDEDTRARPDHHIRLKALMEVCRDFKRVIITCRTQFFAGDDEIPIETGVIRLGPRKASEGREYCFRKLYLSPFDDADVEKYLRRRYPIWRYRLRERARTTVQRIPYLNVRQMLLAHIPDVIVAGDKIRTTYDLYECLVNGWLEREYARDEVTVLYNLSKQLAVDLYASRQTRGAERISTDEFSELANAWGVHLPKWKLTGRSLLNRDADGNWKFAHRSIMEFLFVSALMDCGNPKCFGEILTDQMKVFLAELILRFRRNSFSATDGIGRNGLVTFLQKLHLEVAISGEPLREDCTLASEPYLCQVIDGATYAGRTRLADRQHEMTFDERYTLGYDVSCILFKLVESWRKGSPWNYPHTDCPLEELVEHLTSISDEAVTQCGPAERFFIKNFKYEEAIRALVDLTFNSLARLYTFSSSWFDEPDRFVLVRGCPIGS